ncbi:hypothetical protein AB1Y20_019445 [Prymnesium parvum]|uniref:3-hydroxyacyl-[acyl-carrier-protein] dehydratase n=1 Tax=Prymnesium parvum TaxID=97485 RepID=A0AB34JR78_PRYPA
MDELLAAFNERDAALQPDIVVDEGCGDGSFLQALYAFIELHTLRGRYLLEHPVVMIGVDTSKEVLAVASRRLSGIPHELFVGTVFNRPWLDAKIQERCGCAARGKTLYFSSLIGSIWKVFDTEPIAEQPMVLLDTECGDGALLLTIYRYIRTHTLRGHSIDEYPLIVAGADADPRALDQAARTLAREPHELFSIESPKVGPAEVEARFAGARVLNLRSPLDRLSHFDFYKRSKELPSAALPTVPRHKAITLLLRSGVGRWPGAIQAEYMRDLRAAGGDAIHQVPSQRWATTSLLAAEASFGGFLLSAEWFDNLAFNIGPAEAAAIDPQQRLLLEVTFTLPPPLPRAALSPSPFFRFCSPSAGAVPSAQACYTAAHTAGVRRGEMFAHEVGVYVGIMNTDYAAFSGESVYAATGSQISVASGRLSFALGLQGPVLSVDTACSSALVALDCSMEALRGCACHMSLVASANMLLSPAMHLLFSKAGMLSIDGRSKSFDARANGYVRGEGVGALVVSPSERRHLPACLVASACAVRSDGRSASLTAPSGSAQRAMVLAAAEVAGSATPLVVEAHGSGTSLGDPVELGALRLALGECGACFNGVKANLSHTEPAAGMVGLQSLMQMLQLRGAANAQLRVLNPLLEPLAIALRARLPTQLHSLATPPLAMDAGVSSFGYSGTIAHAVVHATPSDAAAPPPAGRRPLALRPCRFAWVERPHPLVQQRLSSSPSEAIFRSPAGGALEHLVRQHVVRGRVVFPAAAYLEMSCAAAADVGLSHGLVDVFFVAPLFLEPTLAVECVLQLAQKKITVRSMELEADADGGEPVVHCTGRVAPSALTPAATPPPLGEGAVPRDVDSIFDLLHDVGLQYGPSYRRLARVWSDDSRLYGRLLPRRDRQGTSVHPADLDAALQLVVLPSPGEKTIQLPFSVSQTVRGVGSRLMATSVEPSAAGHLVRLQCERTSKLAMALAGVRARALRPDASPQLLHLYMTRWQVVTPLVAVEPMALLLLGDGLPAPQQRALFDVSPLPQVIAALLCQRGEKDSLPLGALEAALVLMQAQLAPLASRRPLWLLAPESSVASARRTRPRAPLPSTKERSVRSLATSPHLFCAGTCKNAVHAGQWGLVRSARAEAQLLVGCIDAPAAGMLSRIAFFKETELVLKPEATVVPRLCHATMTPATPQRDGTPASINTRLAKLVSQWGTNHAVSGGTGGLGLLTARWLGQHQAKALTLASRSGRVSTSFDYHELSRCGADLQIVACDIGESTGVLKLVTSAPLAGPPLQGVWHTAGVQAGAMLINHGASSLRISAAPKVHGAIWLHAATTALALEKRALFSSVMGLLGGVGQANYSASNTCLDSLAACWRAHGTAAVSIQWAAWKEVGMASHGAASARLEAMERSSGFGRINLALGLEALEISTKSSSPAVVALLPFMWSKVAGVVGFVPPLLHDLVNTRVRLNSAPVAAKSQVSSTNLASFNISLEAIDELVGRIIGESRADVDTPLVEAGLDSFDTVELRDRLQGAIDGSGILLPSTLVFDRPTTRALHLFLLEKSRGGGPPQKLEAKQIDSSGGAENSVQVSGLSIALPVGVSGIGKTWLMTHSGSDLLTQIPATRWDLSAALAEFKGLAEEAAHRARHGGFLRNAHLFCAEFFRISKLEATYIDPDQRLLLEHSYQACHFAGNTTISLKGSNIAVNVGQWESEFASTCMRSPAAGSVYGMTGFQTAVTCGRVSFALGLHGPCCTFNTACSASLLANHSSYRALQWNECEKAISASVNMLLDPAAMRTNAIASLTSILGRSHTFGARADGYGRGEAITSVLKQSFEGNGTVSLHGSAVRQDGRSASLTAPNGMAQVQVLGAALLDAQMEPEQIMMIEAHGTGTALGDPIEMGHTEPGAGLSGATKLMAQLLNHTVAPNAHLRILNPHVIASARENCALPVQQSASLLDGAKGGVSSFGYAGTIAHAIYVCESWSDPGVLEPTVSALRMPRFRRRSFPWGGLPVSDAKETLDMSRSRNQEQVSERRTSTLLETKCFYSSKHPPRTAPPLVTLGVDDESGVAVITLNNVSHFNAIEYDLTMDLVEAMDFVTSYVAAKGVVLQGNGPHFCIGAYPHAKLDESSADWFVSKIVSMALGVASLGTRDIRVISAVHGSLLGGGIALCTNTNAVVSDYDATFEQGNLPRGVCPIAAFSHTLIARVGHAAAASIYETNRVINALEAFQLGLVDEVLQGVAVVQRRAFSIAASSACGTMLNPLVSASHAFITEEAVRHAQCLLTFGGHAPKSPLVSISDAHTPAIAFSPLPLASPKWHSQVLIHRTEVAIDPRDSTMPASSLRQLQPVRPLVIAQCVGPIWMQGDPVVSNADFVVAHKDARFHPPSIPMVLSVPVLWRPDASSESTLSSMGALRLGVADMVGSAEEICVEASRMRSMASSRTGPALLSKCFASLRNQAEALITTFSGSQPFGRLGFDEQTCIAVLRADGVHDCDSLLKALGYATNWLLMKAPHSVRVIVLNLPEVPISYLHTTSCLSNRTQEVVERLFGLEAPVVVSAPSVAGGVVHALCAAADYTILSSESGTRKDPHRAGCANEIVSTANAAAHRAIMCASWMASHPSIGQRHMLALMRSTSRALSHSEHLPMAATLRLCLVNSSGSACEHRLGMHRLGATIGCSAITSKPRPWLQGVFSGGGKPTSIKMCSLIHKSSIVSGVPECVLDVAPNTDRDIGIHALEIHVPDFCVSMKNLEQLTGSSAHAKGQTGFIELTGVCAEDEDPVSIAMSAIRKLFYRCCVDPQEIGALYAGTSMILDRSKSMKTDLMALLCPPNPSNYDNREKADVEGVDIYGNDSTAALLAGIRRMQSRSWDGRWALVVTSDILDWPATHPLPNAVAVAALIGPSAPVVHEGRIGNVARGLPPSSPVGWVGMASLIESSNQLSAAGVEGRRKKLCQEHGVADAAEAHSQVVCSSLPSDAKEVMLAFSGCASMGTSAVHQFERQVAPSMWLGALTGRAAAGGAALHLAAQVVSGATSPGKKLLIGDTASALSMITMSVKGYAKIDSRIGVKLAARSRLELPGFATILTSPAGRLRPWLAVPGAKDVARRLQPSEGRSPMRYHVLEDLRQLDFSPNRLVKRDSDPAGKAINVKQNGSESAQLMQLLTSLIGAGVAFPATPTSPAVAIDAGAVVRAAMMDLVSPASADTPLMDVGLDSLGAVEVRNRIAAHLGDDAELSETLVFDYPTVRHLEAHISGLSAAAVPTPICAPAGGAAGANFAQQLRSLMGAGLTPAAPSCPAVAIDAGAVVRAAMMDLVSPASADTPLMDVGLDSLGAVEVRNRIAAHLGEDAELSETLVFDYPTVRQLQAHIIGLSAAAVPTPICAPAGGAAGANFAQQLRSLMGAGLTPAAPSCPAVAIDAGAVVRAAMMDLVSPASADTPLMDVGLDSLGAVEVRNRIAAHLGDDAELSETLVFDYPTARHLEAHIIGLSAAAAHMPICAPAGGAAGANYAQLSQLFGSVAAPISKLAAAPVQSAAISIAGMSCKLPGRVSGLCGLSHMLTTARETTTRVPLTRWDVNEAHRGLDSAIALRASFGAFVSNVDLFDNKHFGIAPAEARMMDPQHRLLLEHSVTVLHDGGFDKYSLSTSGAGVAVGAYSTSFSSILDQSQQTVNAYSPTSSLLCVASGRISFVLGLQGPCLSVETACSSSLVACHIAMRGVQQKDCQDYLALGVNLLLTPSFGIALSAAGMPSPLGKSHTFDSRADGFARGEGCGTILLRYGEADEVRVFALGSTVRQDGRSASLTAPNGKAQESMLHAALADADLNPQHVHLIESHGTGTVLGDPIEVGALMLSLMAERQPGKRMILAVSRYIRTESSIAQVMSVSMLCQTGVKANMAHGESGAGVNGLLTLVLGLKCQKTAPNALLRIVNPHVHSVVKRKGNTILPVVACDLGVQTSTSIGGVSSFGFTGTIAHVILSSSAAAAASSAPRRSNVCHRKSFPIPGKPTADRCFLASVHPKGWNAHGFDDTAVVFRRDRNMRDEAVSQPAPTTLPTSQQLVVVGGGISGVIYAAEWVAAGCERDEVAVLEREKWIGGIWMGHANAYSRVQTAEPAYRLPLCSKQPGPVHQTYSHEIMLDLKALVEEQRLRSRIFPSVNVDRVSKVSMAPLEWVVTGTRLGSSFRITTKQVVLCVNRRLSNIPNRLLIPGEDCFGGDIRNGLANDCEGLQYTGRRVAIIGFGAFAVENLRHALESGAAYSQILCRRRGTVSPKPIDWSNYVRPREPERGFRRAKKGDARLWATWVDCYKNTGAVTPECWAEGKVKPDGHGISVADLFFVAHHLKMANTLVDSIDHLEPGKVVTMRNGCLDTNVLLKCIGFKENYGSERLTGHSHMTCMLQGRVDTGCYVQAEAFLDGSNTENVFGMSVIMIATFNARLLLRVWAKSGLPSFQGLPRDRIGFVKFSNLLEGGHMIREADPEVHASLKHLLDGTTESFAASSSPQRYFERNQQEWSDYHRALLPDIQVECFAPYPFEDLLLVIAEEAPEMVRDVSGGTVNTEKARTCEVGMPQAVFVSADQVVAIAREVSANESIDLDTPLLEAGLDSLGATAFSQSLQDAVGSGTDVPAALVFELPTARQISASLLPSTPLQAMQAQNELTRRDWAAGNTISVEQVLAIAKEVIGDTTIDIDTPLLDAGLDSLGATAFRQSLQDAFSPSTELPAALVFELPTARRVAQSLKFSAPLCPVSTNSMLTCTSQESIPSVQVMTEEAASGWVLHKTRMMRLLADDYFPTIWYSFTTTLHEAREYFECSSSLRTSFVKDKYNERWRWKLRDSLPIYDKTRDKMCWTDQSVTVFFDTSKGELWCNHTVWDAVGLLKVMAAVAKGRRVSQSHWSVHEARVARLLANWEEGDEVVGKVVRAPSLFDDVPGVPFARRIETLPDSVIKWVTAFASRHGASIDNAWYSVIAACALGCLGKSSAPFWFQMPNRDKENANVMGYVTGEVGFICAATLGMSLEHRARQCLQEITSKNMTYKLVFHEIAMCHPQYNKYMATSIGLNLLGSSGPDETDRSYLPEGANAFSEMNWVEIGNEDNNLIQFQGREDIVEFCANVLMPALIAASQPHEAEVALAQKEATVTVSARMKASDDAIRNLDEALKQIVPVPDATDFAVIGAGLAGLTVASILSQDKADFYLIEKTYSAGAHNTNHSHHYELIVDILRLIEQHGLAKRLCTSSDVQSVSQIHQASWLVKGHQERHEFYCLCHVVALCTNRRLGRPRALYYKQEESFKGQVVRGLAYEADVLRCENETAVVTGMGAFAIECVRTALERKATSCTILARRRGGVSPHVLDWTRFIRPGDTVTFRTDSTGDAIVFSKWQQLYKQSTTTKPECWAEGKVKPDGHTLSVSDIFFVAHALGLLRTFVGDVESCTENGVVATACQGDDSAHDGMLLPCTLLIKCVGFEINEGNERILGRSHNRFQQSLWMIYEPHLDNDLFRNLFLTSGHMNTAALFGELLLKYFKHPISLPVAPRYRLNHIVASEMCEKILNFIGKEDPHGHSAMRDSLKSLACQFNETMSATAYLAHNGAHWDHLQESLLALKSPIDPPPTMMPYPFASILAELPDTKAWIDAPSSGRTFDLLENESSLLGLVNPSIETLTFFDGVPPVEELCARVTLIARANPWVSGRLISGDAGSVHLWAPDDGACRVYFAHHVIESLNAHTPPEVAIKMCADFGVKLGLECIDMEEPLFKVNVLSTGDRSFALHVALSHTIGDAATFYSLYSMLRVGAGASPPVALNPTRIPEFQLSKVGPVFSGPWEASHTRLQDSRPKGVKDALKVFQAAARSPARRKKVTVHVIDEEWVQRTKEAHAACARKAGFDFLSTNDVLAWWYYSSSGSSVGTLAFDCRGRVPGVPPGKSDLRPGNYLASIYLSSDDLSSPTDVRQKVSSTLKRATAISAGEMLTAVDKPLRISPSSKISNVTNWSTAYHHLELAGCQHVMHMPVLNSLTDATHGNLYIFRPNPSQLAVLNFHKDNGGACVPDESSPLLPWPRF